MYEINETLAEDKHESIYGWRTKCSAEDACEREAPEDMEITAYNPLNFKLETRMKIVKWRKNVKDSNGKNIYKYGKPIYYTYVKRINYPYFTFKKQTMHILAWLHILKVLDKLNTMVNLKRDVPQIYRRYMWLRKILADYKRRKLRAIRNLNHPDGQHSAFHTKGEVLYDESRTATFSRDPNQSRTNVSDIARYHTVNLSYIYAPYHNANGGSQGIDSDFEILQKRVWKNFATDPINHVSDRVGSMALWLWPGADDFLSENDRAQPAVDLAEALADGSLIGEPPNVSSFLNQEHTVVGLMHKSIKFSANSLLWYKLVIEPVVSSAVALSASIVSNDIIMDNLLKSSKEGKWFQGKARPYFKDSSGFVTDFGSNIYKREDCAVTDSVDDVIKYPNMKAFGQMRYKLSYIDMLYMHDSSAARMGLYFNQLSTSLREVMHNVVPLSFVFDWFSSRVSLVQNLQKKVLVPVEDWAITSSVKAEMENTRVWTRIGGYNKFTCRRPPPWNTVLLGYTGWWPQCDLQPCASISPRYSVTTIVGFYEINEEAKRAEKFSYYYRIVDRKPMPVAPQDFDMPNRPTIRALPDQGKLVTLSALIYTLTFK